MGDTGTALDGNAVAGLLVDVFGEEMTDAECTCGSCGAHFVVAEALVYLRGPGTVVRCRRCSATLMVLVAIRGVTCVDLGGVAALGARGAS